LKGKNPKEQPEKFIAKYTKPVHKQTCDEKVDWNCIHIWSWNVNGIRAVINKNRIQEFFEKANPQILCLQETKIDEERLIAESIKDKFPSAYYQYWSCCKPPIRGYAGTVIFSKIKPLSVEYGIGTPKHDREGRTVTLEYPYFFLVAVYVPNSGATLKWHHYRTHEWDLDFRAFLKGLEMKGKPVILAGDLNVAH
jgi:exodeoxyribonuclease III